MWTWMLGVALAGGDPGVVVDWKGDDAHLHVRPPSGEHVAPDAPFDLSLLVGDRSLVVSGMGEDVVPGVPVGDVRGRVVEGALQISLCEDGGSRCRIVEVGVSGTADDRRRGTLALAVGPLVAEPTDEGHGWVRADARATWDDAVVRSRETGLPILLDFGAVWCPPCNLMDAELFEAERRPAVVDAFVIAKIDVDDPSSWELKDRFAVGGYPTVVAVDADGAELGRKVGYDGVDDMVVWLDAVATGEFTRRPGDPSPADAARQAWRLVRAGRDQQAVGLVEIGAAEPDMVELRLARIHLDPTLADARWLAERAPGHAIQWVGAAMGLADADPEAAAVLRQAIRADLATATPMHGSDLLWYSAQLADDPADAQLHYGAAAALVRSQLTGDPQHDKGHLNWLAELTEESGRPDDAVAILEQARRDFPEEPTFHTYLARTWLRQGRYDDAYGAAMQAWDVGWGDNRLTAARVAVEALVALGRRDEAEAFVDEVLATLPEPTGDLDVRTHRYRDALKRSLGE